jgi:glycosyltransferase involved in cell wall biosynthesis
MRLLLLAQFFPPDIGGEERHVFNLANTLADRGHDVSVGTQRFVGVPDEEVLPSGVCVYRFETMAMKFPGVYSTARPHHPPLPDPLGVRALRRIVRQVRPEVIHAHNWIINSALALKRRAVDVPYGLVLTLHDYSQVCSTKRLMRRGSVCTGPGFSRCLRCSTAHYGSIVGPVTTIATTAMRPWKNLAIDHIISVSRAVANGNRIPDGPHSSIVPNFVLDSIVLPETSSRSESITCNLWPPIYSGHFLLFVGDLSREKGLLTLLNSYEMLDANRPALVLIGRRTSDTPARLPEGVRLYENWPHEHVLAALRACTIAVLPSLWPDPCPTTVLEAMASGKPVITTSTGGMIDMIDDGKNGLLVSPGNESELAAAIARLLTQSHLRTQLGTGALAKVRDFTASAVANSLETIYAKVCAGKLIN